MNRLPAGKAYSKETAINYVARAVKEGRLTRAPCTGCGATNTHGHHEDYSKPLEVIWLCPRCHARRHVEIRTGGQNQGQPDPKPSKIRERITPVNVTVRGYKTAQQVAEATGLSLETVYYRLRHDPQLIKGEKVGRDWFVTDAEVAKVKAKGPLKKGRTLADRAPPT